LSEGVTSISLGFLGASPFRRENPAYEGWISLDFLGFSRQNLDLSMGCAGFSAKVFSWALSWREKPEREPAVEAMRKGGTVHGTSLLQFLIVSNQLSSVPAPAPPVSACSSLLCKEELLSDVAAGSGLALSSIGGGLAGEPVLTVSDFVWQL
jgi:hypothetical protein